MARKTMKRSEDGRSDSGEVEVSNVRFSRPSFHSAQEHFPIREL
jgi:hypothetical protein